MAGNHTPQQGPSSVAAEEHTLGALMIDRQAWPLIAGRLGAEDFSRPDHALIFAAIESLADARRPINTLFVTDCLQRANNLDAAGGAIYISRLACDTGSTSYVAHYADIVRDRAGRRRLVQLGEFIAAHVLAESDQPVEELVGTIQQRLLEVQTRARSGGGLVSAQDLVRELVDDMDRRREQPQGLSVGLSDFDSLTSGLEPGDLIVIAARPGVGKTALAVTLMLNTSEHAPVAFFSAEMPALQLMRRAVARESSVSQRKLRRAEQLTDSDWSVIADAVGIIARRPIWIDDKPLPSLTHVRAECMLRKAQGGLGLVLIDYIQLVQGRGKNRYEELRDVSYGLKALAKELAVPIVVLAQLNRSVESREQKRPHISDLRDCGAIEEAADIVGLLYSEGYYHPDCSMPYVLECAIAKNRNGERGECLWRFNGDHSRVTVLETGATAQYRHNRAKQHTARGNEDL